MSKAKLIFLPLLLAMTLVMGCRDEDKTAEAPAPAETAAEAMAEPEAQEAQAAQDEAVAEEPQAEEQPAGRVYALSEPEEPASPEEQEKARRIIEYANRMDAVFAGACGQEPVQIAAGILNYSQEYDAFKLEKPQPAHCLKKALTPPEGAFDEADARTMADSLDEMDSRRVSMRKTYDRLCDYIADDEIQDDGALGAKLSAETAEHIVAYAAAASVCHALVDRLSLEAQSLLLRDHPLRDHVVLAGEIAVLIKKQAAVIAQGEPDPADLNEPLAELEDKVQTGGWLPFPVSGEPEMHYRHFLKQAARAAAAFRLGQRQSFHKDVRQELNDAWQALCQDYNLFVDAVDSR